MSFVLQSMKWQKWHSWGSPVGLSIFFISLTVCALVLRYAYLM